MLYKSLKKFVYLLEIFLVHLESLTCAIGSAHGRMWKNAPDVVYTLKSCLNPNMNRLEGSEGANISDHFGQTYSSNKH